MNHLPILAAFILLLPMVPAQDEVNSDVIDKPWEEQFQYIQESIRRTCNLQPTERRRTFLQDGINFLLSGESDPRRIPETDKQLVGRLTPEQRAQVIDYIESLKADQHQIDQ